MLANAENAKRWLRWFLDNDKARVYMLPWLAEVELSCEGPVIPWEEAITRDEEIVRRCDGVVLVGGRVSMGMARERDAALAAGKKVRNLSMCRTPAQLERWNFDEV
jgi:hypothetical protein